MEIRKAIKLVQDKSPGFMHLREGRFSIYSALKQPVTGLPPRSHLHYALQPKESVSKKLQEEVLMLLPVSIKGAECI